MIFPKSARQRRLQVELPARDSHDSPRTNLEKHYQERRSCGRRISTYHRAATAALAKLHVPACPRITCTICHGPNLKGLGEVPSIAGRPATYIFRQLNDMKIGNRNGPWVELMKQVVAKLDDDDMIALSAYLGSLDP